MYELLLLLRLLPALLPLLQRQRRLLISIIALKTILQNAADLPLRSSSFFRAASSRCFLIMASRARSAFAWSVFPAKCIFIYLSLAFCFSISSLIWKKNVKSWRHVYMFWTWPTKFNIRFIKCHTDINWKTYSKYMRANNISITYSPQHLLPFSSGKLFGSLKFYFRDFLGFLGRTIGIFNFY